MTTDYALSLKIHSAAEAFPEMSASDFAELVDDISRNGLRSPIQVLDGQILDGRHRFKACVQAGVEPNIVEVNLEGQSPAEYVWSTNGVRRHLTPSQKAAIAVDFLPNLEDKAKERQNLGQKIDRGEKGRASEKAASIVGVNRQYVAEAKKLKSTDPIAFARIKSGELSLSAARKPHVTRNSGQNEWYTPSIYIDAARQVMGTINLDPASSAVAQRFVKAERFYTINDDGLKQDWKGKVRLNPPYEKQLVELFASRLAQEYSIGNVTEAIVLVNNATETRWFQKLFAVADAICIPKGRIRFLDETGEPKQTPLQGQVFLYFGSRFDFFMSRFQVFGAVSRVDVQTKHSRLKKEC